jgi:hypothetical protein
MIENKLSDINEIKIGFKRVISLVFFSTGLGIVFGASLEMLAPSHQIIPIAMVFVVVNGIALYRSR